MSNLKPLLGNFRSKEHLPAIRRCKKAPRRVVNFLTGSHPKNLGLRLLFLTGLFFCALNAFAEKGLSEIASFHRDVTNRLAVMMVIDGQIEESVRLGKSAQNKRPDQELIPEIVERCRTIISHLEEKKDAVEIGKWKARLNKLIPPPPVELKKPLPEPGAVIPRIGVLSISSQPTIVSASPTPDASDVEEPSPPKPVSTTDHSNIAPKTDLKLSLKSEVIPSDKPERKPENTAPALQETSSLSTNNGIAKNPAPVIQPPPIPPASDSTKIEKPHLEGKFGKAKPEVNTLLQQLKNMVPHVASAPPSPAIEAKDGKTAAKLREELPPGGRSTLSVGKNDEILAVSLREEEIPLKPGMTNLVVVSPPPLPAVDEKAQEKPPEGPVFTPPVAAVEIPISKPEVTKIKKSDSPETRPVPLVERTTIYPMVPMLPRKKIAEPLPPIESPKPTEIQPTVILTPQPGPVESVPRPETPAAASREYSPLRMENPKNDTPIAEKPASSGITETQPIQEPSSAFSENRKYQQNLFFQARIEKLRKKVAWEEDGNASENVSPVSLNKQIPAQTRSAENPETPTPSMAFSGYTPPRGDNPRTQTPSMAFRGYTPHRGDKAPSASLPQALPLVISPPISEMRPAKARDMQVPGIGQEVAASPTATPPKSKPLAEEPISKPIPDSSQKPLPESKPAKPEFQRETIVREIRIPKNSSSDFTISRPLLPKREKPETTLGKQETRPEKAITLSSQSRNQLKELSNVKATVNFKDAEIADVVRLLAEKADLNVVSRKPIVGQATVKFDNIPIGTALDILLRSNGYSYKFDDNIIWVFRKGEEPTETRLFLLCNADANDILTVVKNTLQEKNEDMSIHQPSLQVSPAPSDGAGGTTVVPQPPRPAIQRDSYDQNWNVQLDRRSNSIIVTASVSKLDEIGKLIEVMDEATQQDGIIEERIFNLKYIDRPTLEKAIKLIIPRFDAKSQVMEVPKRGATAAKK